MQRERPRLSTQIVDLSSIHIGERLRALRPDVVATIAASMAEIGLLHPIVLKPKGKGFRLVVGCHRVAAAKSLKWETIRAVVDDDISDDRAELAEIDENLERADLSPAERALHVGRRKELYEKLHPETKHGATGRRGKKDAKFASFTETTAKATGQSKRKIALDATRARQVVVLADIVGTALDQGDELDALAKLPASEQRKLAARAKAGEKVQVKVAVMKARRVRREQELAEATATASQALGKKLFGVIYADPPWRYDNVPMGDVARQNEQHYPSMALEDIKALRIPAADDCVLFLWATVPLLPEALAVMAAWGFTYKSASTWVKDKAGTGYWVRGVVEALLIGRRGDVPAPAPGEQFPGVIEAPRGRHSEKPAIFAEHIERLFPNVPKLEMFARTSRAGWDSWGNEVPMSEAAP